MLSQLLQTALWLKLSTEPVKQGEPLTSLVASSVAQWKTLLSPHPPQRKRLSQQQIGYPEHSHTTPGQSEYISSPQQHTSAPQPLTIQAEVQVIYNTEADIDADDVIPKGKKEHFKQLLRHVKVLAEASKSSDQHVQKARNSAIEIHYRTGQFAHKIMPMLITHYQSQHQEELCQHEGVLLRMSSGENRCILSLEHAKTQHDLSPTDLNALQVFFKHYGSHRNR